VIFIGIVTKIGLDFVGGGSLQLVRPISSMQLSIKTMADCGSVTQMGTSGARGLWNDKYGAARLRHESVLAQVNALEAA
jgi:hypothetical protein